MRNDEDINMFLNKDLKRSRSSYLNNGYSISKDSKGHNIGYRRKNFLRDDVTNHYDNRHNIVGYSLDTPHG